MSGRVPLLFEKERLVRAIERDGLAGCATAIMACTEAAFAAARRLGAIDRTAALAVERLAAAIELATLDWIDRQRDPVTAIAQRHDRRLH